VALVDCANELAPCLAADAAVGAVAAAGRRVDRVGDLGVGFFGREEEEAAVGFLASEAAEAEIDACGCFELVVKVTRLLGTTVEVMGFEGCLVFPFNLSASSEVLLVCVIGDFVDVPEETLLVDFPGKVCRGELVFISGCLGEDIFELAC